MAEKRLSMHSTAFATALLGAMLLLFGLATSIKLSIFSGILVLVFSITIFTIVWK